jgi:hypothetical protein
VRVNHVDDRLGGKDAAGRQGRGQFVVNKQVLMSPADGGSPAMGRTRGRSRATKSTGNAKQTTSPTRPSNPLPRRIPEDRRLGGRVLDEVLADRLGHRDRHPRADDREYLLRQPSQPGVINTTCSAS